MYYPSPNRSAEPSSLMEDSPPDLPFDNVLQHRTTHPADVATSVDTVTEHRRALEAAMVHKASSSDRFLQSAQEREAMQRAAVTRDVLRAASAKRAENATKVMQEAAQTRARNVDTNNSNCGCTAIWDFGCPIDIFQAACDGDVHMLNANLAAAASEVERAVVAILGAPIDQSSPSQWVLGGRQSPAGHGELEDDAVDARALEVSQARDAAIAGSTRVALAANLINAVGQPLAKTYTGVQFEKRWTFQAPPLALAAAFNRERAVKALLDWGASPNQTSSTGLTALDYAQQRGYTVIADMLVAAVQHTRVDANTSDLTPNSNTM